MNKSINQSRNLFTYRMPVIKLAVKELQNAKFYAIFLIIVMLVGIFSLSPVISSLMGDVIIRSSGRIATMAPMAYKSEIRGVFIHCATFGYSVDWDLIAQTCKDYGINRIYGEFMSTGYGYYDSDLFQTRYGNQLGMAIDACHARGIEVHASMDVMGDMAARPEFRCVDSDGNLINWNCPSNPAYRDLVRQTVEEVAAKYDIDGFMFDYIRYVLVGTCYCEYCKAAFEEWLGETIPDSNWPPNPSDFAPEGSRWYEFLEWRIIPITTLVRDIRNWMTAIKPDIEFSVAAWTPPAGGPAYWRKFIGQDTADWVAKGYIDVVAPMLYFRELPPLEDELTENLKYMVGGPEGKTPLVAFLRNDFPEPDLTPEQLKAQIDLVRQFGADGWIIWRYGGPGGHPDIAPDIRDYLSIIDLPDIFTLGNIQVSAGDTQATVTWTTDLPATSKVEYSTSPLFAANFITEGNFPYWDIDHVPGTVVEDSTPVTNHNITLTDLLPETKYHFRVQSQDPSGIATSKAMNFTTAAVAP